MVTEKKKLEKMYSQVSEDHSNVTKALENTRRNSYNDLMRKDEELQARNQKITELTEKLEASEMKNKQLSEQLSAVSRNLDQALDR